MSTVERYLGLIKDYESVFRKWEGRVEKILKRYKDEYRNGTRGYTEARFNVLWSNVNTLVPAVFAKLPKPDVSRRFRDNDPVGRVAAMILERALEYEVEHYPDYEAAMKNSVFDRFLGGRGVSWVRYEPHMAYETVDQPIQGLQVSEDSDEAQQVEVLDYECAPVDYVHWKDFGHEIARTWEEVGIVWRKVYLKRAALIERFGEEIGESIPLDTKPDELKKAQYGETGDYEACIYEIWDKPRNVAVWVHKSRPEPLDEKEDPLGVESFFPCPRPLYATITTDSLVPTPDFTLYQDQANELDILCDRIDGLIKALQVKGVYNASFKELARLFTEGENNTLMPVDNWNAFAEKNGLKGAIDIVDLTPIASALLSAYQAMEQVKAQIYEITGLSDIVRGQSEAQETATAQRIKGQYASLRLKTMQYEVSRFAASLMRLKAQVICKFFAPETIIKISAAEQLAQEDQQYIEPAIALLKSGELNSFRVEIAVDSLVQIDEESEKESRMEFLTATGSFLREAVPAVQAAPEIAPLLMELLKFGVRSFKVGKSIEGVFDQVAEQIKQAQANPQPKPDPEMAKVQAQRQMDADRVASQERIDIARAQSDAAAAQAESAAKERTRIEELRYEDIRHQRDSERAWNEAKLKADTAVVVAQIGKEGKIKTAAMSANASADPDSPTELDETGETKPKSGLVDLVNAVNENMTRLIESHQTGQQQLFGQMGESHGQLMQAINRPRKRTMRRADGTVLTSMDEPA